MHGKSHDSRGHYLHFYHAKPQVMAKPSVKAQKVNAQTKTEKYVQIVVNEKKYSIKKSAIEEINHSNLWLEKLNISA